MPGADNELVWGECAVDRLHGPEEMGPGSEEGGHGDDGVDWESAGPVHPVIAAVRHHSVRNQPAFRRRQA